MTMYNVFDTQAEAEAAQEYDFQCEKSANYSQALTHDNIEQLARYYVITTRTSEVKQRLDGKWCYRVCTASDAVYTTEEKTEPWFAEEEDIEQL